MRLILTFLVILSFKSCKTTIPSGKETTSLSSQSKCPDDGICNLEIIKDSNFEIKTDEFGSLYPELTSGKYIVLKFEYKRNEIPNTADSGYRELIYLRLNPESLVMNIQDKNLSNVNLLFGRLCFCRGQTGYYRISSGNLSIKSIKKNTYQIDLQFKTDEVPQILHHINETIQL